MQSPQEEKRKRTDGLVKKLAEEAFSLTKLLAENKPYITELKNLDSLTKQIRSAQGRNEPFCVYPNSDDNECHCHALVHWRQ